MPGRGGAEGGKRQAVYQVLRRPEASGAVRGEWARDRGGVGQAPVGLGEASRRQLDVT